MTDRAAPCSTESMATSVDVKWDKSQIGALQNGPFKSATVRALKKAGATALRDMRSEARKRITSRKRIKGKYVSRAITLARAKGSDIPGLEWAVNLSGAPVPLIAYPARQTRKGVSVEVNRGKRTLIPGAFIATMRSGHVGVFRRRGKSRLPIKELLGSRPVDALLHEGESEAVAERGAASFGSAFVRLLPLEIGKSK